MVTMCFLSLHLFAQHVLWFTYCCVISNQTPCACNALMSYDGAGGPLDGPPGAQRLGAVLSDPRPPSGRMMELEDLWMVHPEPSGSVLFCLTPVPPQVV